MIVLTPGTKIKERYALKEFKGSGSFGEVWLAHDVMLDQDVAIKIFLSFDPRGVEEFSAEYSNTVGISHKNLLTTEHFDIWEQRPFLVMKYCANGSAAALAGNMEERQLWEFILDVANGLNHLHNLPDPIVHQDIKPDNILMDEENNFLITDFGISKRMRSTMRRLSRRAIGAGAPAYMAPERFEEDPTPVKASDIWSLGASIYELATGELPFSGLGGGMQKNGADIPTLPSPWSDELNLVMKACLSKETWDRPTADQVAAYAESKLKGEKPSPSLISRHAYIQQPEEPKGLPDPQEEPEPEIYYDEEGNIDFDQYEKLGKLAKMILYGGIVTAVLGIINFFSQLNNSELSGLEVAASSVETVLYVILAGVCYRAIKKRKPDAMFLSKCFLFYCLISWIVSFLISFNIIGVIVVIWCIMGIYWVYRSDDARTVFPKTFRKVTWKDIVGVLCVFLVPFTLGLMASVQKNEQPPTAVHIDSPVVEPKQPEEELVIPEVEPIETTPTEPASPLSVQPKQEPNNATNVTEEPQKRQEQKDDKAATLRIAINNGDYQTVQKLANQGYAPAYGPLAKYYLNHNEYSAAETYARKAMAAGQPEGQQVIKALTTLGYYD